LRRGLALAISGKFCRRGRFVLGDYPVRIMKKINNAAKQNRSFRRFINQLLSSLIKRQKCGCHKEFENVLEKLQGIEDSIEIIARQIARWVKSGE
jgi:hypothetical protein